VPNPRLIDTNAEREKDSILLCNKKAFVVIDRTFLHALVGF
jgi:hypothetical protein